MSQVISETAARAWVDAREWKKGEPYVRGLTNLSVRASGDAREYRAVAHGQEAYRVSVTVQDGKVKEADCSCPVGGGGGCKHTAALLNKLSRDPKPFVEVPALEDLLNDLDLPALRRLVARMLAKAPELETLLYAQVSPNLPADDFAPRVHAAFSTLMANYNHYEEWDSEDGPDTEAIEAILVQLDRRREKLPDLNEEETAALARAYIAVLNGVESFYDRNDMDYGLEEVQEEGMLGLYDLFVSADLDDDLREEALKAIRNEIVSHRADLGRDEFHDFYAVLNADEQRSVYDLIESLSKKSESYRRRSYLQALIDLRGGEPTDDDTEQLLRADYNPTQLIIFLLEKGRLNEADVATQGMGRIPFEELRPAFEKAGMLARLEEFALKQTHHRARDALVWLHDLYLETGRDAQAYRMAQIQAQQDPNTEWFKRLKTDNPNWEKDRTEVIKALRKNEKHWNPLLKLLVSEGLTDQAFELVNHERSQASGLLMVARMPALDAQRAAILIIRAGQKLIAPRHRNAYADAAKVLQELISKVGLTEAKTLVAAHFPERQKLPALRDELQKAGLL